MNRERIASICTLAISGGLVIRASTWDSPSLMWVSIFWSCTLPALFVLAYVRDAERIQRCLVAVGASLNAAAMLVNGGAMPVVGLVAAHGVWVPWSHTRRLWLIVDNAVSSGGWSVGDLVILSGILIALSKSLHRRIRARAVAA